MNAYEFKIRTKKLAFGIIRLFEELPKSGSGSVLGRQILRSGTSIGANYRSACTARSMAEFVAKMGIVEEECDETIYWMELLLLAGIVKSDRINSLMKEAQEIRALVVASLKTAKSDK